LGNGITAMRSDRSEFPTELTVVRVELEGPPIFTAFIRDITERKKTQAALAEARAALEQTVVQRTSDLQKTISELESFSYSLSHDMRAALRPIHSFIEIVLTDASIESPLPMVTGHEAYLTQIVTNLLSNAVKFVKPGIQPQIRTHSDAKDGRVRIWFDDNGIGLPPGASGALDVESGDKKGSRFWIELSAA
jgi:signal transduction histidine kinase